MEMINKFITGDFEGGEINRLKFLRVTQFTPQEKSYLFYNLMDKALPRMNEALATKKVRPAAITAFMQSPGFASDLVNTGLNEEEQSYLRNLQDFAAGVLRKESGAAITHSELKDVFRRYASGFGDVPATETQKAAAAQEYLDSMRTLAGPAVEYYRTRAQTGAPRSRNAPPGTTKTVTVNGRTFQLPD